MPRKAKRVCAEPGCPVIVDGSRCETHARKPWSTHGAGIGRGRQWRRARWACFERDNFTCTEPGCGHVDRTGATLEADHIGPTDALEHLRTLCKAHHAAKTLHDAAVSRRASHT